MRRVTALLFATLMVGTISGSASAHPVQDSNFGPCTIDVLNTPSGTGSGVRTSAAVHCSRNVNALTLTVCLEYSPVVALRGPSAACSTAGPHAQPRSVEDASVSTVCAPGWWTAYASWSAQEGRGDRHSATVNIPCR